MSDTIKPEEAIRLRVPGYKTKWPQNEAKDTNTNRKIIQVPNEEKREKSDKDIVKQYTEPVITGDVQSKPEEKNRQTTLEPEFLSEEYLTKYYPYIDMEHLKQFYPKSRMEFIITVSLILLSIICITYFIMVLYRLMCSRKYSKWRASWNKVPKNARGNSYYKQIKEAVPIVLKGHLQV